MSTPLSITAIFDGATNTDLSGAVQDPATRVFELAVVTAGNIRPWTFPPVGARDWYLQMLSVSIPAGGTVTISIAYPSGERQLVPAQIEGTDAVVTNLLIPQGCTLAIATLDADTNPVGGSVRMWVYGVNDKTYAQLAGHQILSPDGASGGDSLGWKAETVPALEVITSANGLAVGDRAVVTGTGNIYRALTAAAGGSTWAPASGRWTFQDFGADPSGVVDSTAAIVGALEHARDAGGGDVFGERGDYLTSSQMRCEDDVRLFGVGFATRIFSVTDLPMLFIQGDDVSISSLSVEGSGNVLDATQALIRVSGNVSRATVDDVWLTNAGAEAFRCLGAANSLTDSDLSRIRTLDCQRGIEFVDSVSANIRCRDITTRGLTAVNGIAFTHDAVDILIEGCSCEADGFPISVAGIKRVTIRDCDCFGALDVTRGEGIHLETSNSGVGVALTDVLVEGCRSHGNRRGIVFGGNDDIAPFRSCERIQIRNNEVFDNSLVGIYGFDFVGAQVVGNVVWGSGLQGIFCTREEITNDAQDLRIEGNQVYDNDETAAGVAGIEVGGGVERYQVLANISRSGAGFGAGTQSSGIEIASVDTMSEVSGNICEGNTADGIVGPMAGVVFFEITTTDDTPTEVAEACDLSVNGDVTWVRMVAIGTERAGTGRVQTVLERTFERTAGTIGTLGTVTNSTARKVLVTAAADLPTNGSKKMARVTGEVATIIDWKIRVWSERQRDQA